jgi:cholesterol transport system auxiliary component
MRAPRILALAMLGPLLVGCGSVLPKPPPEPDLYTLTAPAPPDPAKSRHPVQILVALPQSTAALDSVRIALTQSPTSFEYYADAAWTDHAPSMLQSLLVETLERTGLFAAVARSSSNLRADETLISDLRHFEAEYRGGAPQARVEIDFKLVKTPEGSIIAEKDFSATAPASTNTVSAVVEALNNATHQVLSQVGPWIASSPPAGPRRNR